MIQNYHAVMAPIVVLGKPNLYQKQHDILFSKINSCYLIIEPYKENLINKNTERKARHWSVTSHEHLLSSVQILKLMQSENVTTKQLWEDRREKRRVAIASSYLANFEKIYNWNSQQPLPDSDTPGSAYKVQGIP